VYKGVVYTKIPKKVMRVYVKTNYAHSAEGKGSRRLKDDTSKSCAKLPEIEH